MNVVAFCDGGCNNTTKADAYGSFAVRLESDDIASSEIIKRYKYNHLHTSNEAEYETLILLLEFLFDNGYTIDSGFQEITIYSDSQLVVNQVNGNWKISAEHLKRKCWYAQDMMRWVGNTKLVWTPRKNIVEVLGH